MDEPTSKEPEGLLKTRSILERLSISRRTLQRMTESGKVSPAWSPNSRVRRWRWSDFAKLNVKGRTSYHKK